MDAPARTTSFSLRRAAQACPWGTPLVYHQAVTSYEGDCCGDRLRRDTVSTICVGATPDEAALSRSACIFSTGPDPGTFLASSSTFRVHSRLSSLCQRARPIRVAESTDGSSS